MSYAFTSRPSVSQSQRGRGRGASNRGRGRGSFNENQVEQKMQNQTSNQQSSPNGKPQSEENRVQRGSGFTMIAPKPEKRQAVLAQAKNEEERYKQYKEQHRLKHVSYVGTVGGGSSKSPATSSPVKKKTLAERRAEEKQKEQAQLDQKKQAARQQTMRNEVKSGERNRRLDEERKRANNAFLDRFEQQRKSKSSTSTDNTLYKPD